MLKCKGWVHVAPTEFKKTRGKRYEASGSLSSPGVR